MSTDIYLVKYLKDPIRREPQNVGLFVVSGDQTAARFQGFDPKTGHLVRSIDGVPRDIYSAWMGYFRERVDTGDWDGIRRLVASRPRDFYLEHALHKTEDSDPSMSIESYYEQLVRRASSTKASLKDQAETLFLELGTSPKRNVRVTGKDAKGTTQTSFDYQINNYYIGLLSGAHLKLSAGDFAYRATIAESAGVNEFISFADLKNSNEEDYYAAERFGPVVDPYEDNAKETVSALIS